MEHPDKKPPQLETSVMRHEMIEGDLYVNIDDLLKILTILKNDYMRSTAMIIKESGFAGLRDASFFQTLAMSLEGVVHGLNEYTEQAKFEKVVEE